MAYDTHNLDRLGARRIKLRAELAAIEDALAEEVPRARAGGVTVAYVMRATSYAKSWVEKLAARAGVEEGASGT